jgi:hypothetical protein
MKTALQLQYLWHDTDVLEIGISASNGRFAASTSAYLSLDGLAEAATTVEGFPRNGSDMRELRFGASGEEFAGGYAFLRFSCVDGPCHAEVVIHIEDKNTGPRPGHAVQSAHFFAWIEAAAVDDFVADLRKMDELKSGIASLKLQKSTC